MPIFSCLQHSPRLCPSIKRHNVEVRDIKTNETTIYPSTYKVIKELGLYPYDKRKVYVEVDMRL